MHIHRHKSVCVYAYVSRLYAYVHFTYICICMCIYLTTHWSATDSYHPLIIVLFVDRRHTVEQQFVNESFPRNNLYIYVSQSQPRRKRRIHIQADELYKRIRMTVLKSSATTSIKLGMKPRLVVNYRKREETIANYLQETNTSRLVKTSNSFDRDRSILQN